MKHIRKQWSKILVLFFTACMLLGGGIAYAAPMLWSYPDNHLLISEVEYYGSPSSDPSSEWVEVYNPTNRSIASYEFFIYAYNDTNNNEVTVLNLDYPDDIHPVTPTPGPPYASVDSHCFLYIANDANAFFNEYGQCPDFAENLDPINCPATLSTTTSGSWTTIGLANDSSGLCLYSNTAGLDSVGWGSGGTGALCIPVINPLSGGAAGGETYLRGSNSPEWIGPGGEGTEPVQPSTEQLDEVWHLSGSVNVPWEGPEVGVCRQPTAIGLQNPQASAAQDSGYVLLMFGLIGLVVTTTAIVWRKGQNIPIKRSE